MTITVITGANKGLGRETARRLIELGHTVYVSGRDAERTKRAAADLGARPLLLDVTEEASVRAAAATVREEAGRVDVLVNNAGVSVPRATAEDLTADVLRAMYEPNVFGPVRVTSAFLPLLAAASHPVVVNVSSGLGSLAINEDPSRAPDYVPAPAYASSKAALNMLTIHYAKALPGIRFNAVDPGYTATDLNGHRGRQTVEEGARVIVAAATAPPGTPTGTFTNMAGRVPW
ncbi:SDR family NAD(P)-dependent oxidoreductase [Sphaerisporangium sp. NPDC088356]|uniref:SDR family NAD(P)-dependent oxidoreductase n=1 Tax=Sphaerisporangium sp. NPDC088356 TaxID=3154871 RepID=UPI00343A053F